MSDVHIAQSRNLCYTRRGMNDRPKIESRVLSAIFRLPVPTRRTIAAHLQSSHVTIGKALQALEQAGEIHAADAVLPSGSGRPSEVFSIREEAFYGVGIYIQPSNAQVVLLNASKTVVGEWSILFEDTYRQRHEVETVLRDVAAEAMSRVSAIVVPEAIVSVGIAVPGFVNTEQCVWTGGLQFGHFSNLDVRGVLADLTSATIHVEDASRSLTQLQLMSEQSTQAERNFVLINMGVGLGAGLVMDGRVFYGNGGFAGEIGHVSLGNNTNRCPCGNVGCTETILSASGIRAVFSQRLIHGIRSELKLRPDLARPPTIEEIRTAADNEDHFTRTTLTDLGLMLGDLIDLVVKFYTPGPVVLAGEGALLSEYLLPHVTRTLSTKSLPEMVEHVRVYSQPYDGTNEARGAALLGISKMLAQSAQ